MRFSKYLPLLVLLFGFTAGFSQTFTVTNRADSGPGTLRQALLSIPSNPISYKIDFNLPGSPTEENRTIRLKTVLPQIPSNVIIDGSSQPSWPALGVSGAKIIIEPESPALSFHGLRIGVDYADYTTYRQVKNVEIYGLFLRNFAQIPSLQNVNTNQGSGIVIDYRSANIKIGAPGKGNVIGGTINGIWVNNQNYYSTTTLDNISIQSNLIGVLYDGTTPIPNLAGITANLYETSIAVGGDNTGEGNTISANQTNINITRFNSSGQRTSVTIVNNKIGADFSGTADYQNLPLFLLSSSLEIHGVKVNSYNTDVYLRKNIISGNRTTGVTISNADFILTSNSIGTGTARTEQLGNGVGVRVEGSAKGTIGGTVTADLGNFITNNSYGVELLSTGQVKIMRNSFYCNKIFGIGPSLNYTTQAFVQILVKRPDRIEGKASPNAEVELFQAQNCNNICEGKDYLVTVQADANGKWTYPSPVTGNVTATATTLNGTTSQFSSSALRDDDVIVTPVNCNGNGSIKIPDQREGFTFTWNRIEEDGSRTLLVPAGTTQEITGLSVGLYEVIVDNGCQPLPKQFSIKDQKIKNLVVNWPTPGCGQTSFSFSASVELGDGATTYRWTNVTTGATFLGQNVTMPQGTYKVRATDAAGCILESAPKDITRLPSPIINIASRVVGPATCGEANGAIKNILVTDTVGVVAYRWYVMNFDALLGRYVRGNEVGRSRELTNVAGGVYTLEVKDQGGCPAVQIESPYITITITNAVKIIGGTPIQTTCGNDNGAIKAVIIEKGNSWVLTNTATGSIVKTGTCDPGVAFDIQAALPVGNYTLNASNSVTGCTAGQPAYYTITPKAITVYTVQIPDIVRPACEQNNGSIHLTYTSIDKPVQGKYQWKNADDLPIQGTSTDLKDLDEGSYTLYITDVNGCVVPLGPYQVSRIDLLVVDQNSGTPVPDVCNLGRGSITGVKIRGGLPTVGDGTSDNDVYTYRWIDVNTNLPVGATKDLLKMSAGTYMLEVSDQTKSRCGVYTSRPITIDGPTVQLALPSIEASRRVCYATEIMIPVLAPEEGDYELYENKDDARPLTHSTKGILILNVAKTADYYIKRKLGTCESDFTALHIEVTNDNLKVTNTITPNGDGMNDNWMITGLPDEGDISIKLYNRSGQLVYESLGQYNKPFDGRFRGKDLPAGVYYYKIDLRADCAPLGGSLTLLR